ncbi:hypothetical protein KA005_44705, partial [bacterium]|nr:hypothetical protein [bacterium]
ARLDDDIGNRRAIAFENSVNREIENNFGKKRIWVTQKRIVNSNGVSKEIDSSLIIRDVLFIIEAKSKNVSFGFDMGDINSISYRIKEFKSALKQALDKVEFLVNNINDINISMPSSVSYLVPIVISPHSEYIWTKDSSMFLDSGLKIPRVITIDDLPDFKTLNLSFLKKQEYCKKIE